MIKNKSTYKYYLKEDKTALGVKGIKDYIFHDIWRFQRILRAAEYYNNRSGFKVVAYFYRYFLSRYGRKLGFSIPINTFGPGLSIAHRGTIVVNSRVRIGARCRIHVCVNIGSSPSNSYLAPKLGDDCYIAPGAKIYGGISIGDNTGIGANSVVNKSFEAGHQTIAGSPAKVISKRGPLDFRSFSINN